MAATTGDHTALGAATALRPVGDPEAPAERRAARPRRSRCDKLSGKERLVLAELARGNSTDEIGIVLSVSPHTVRTHVKNLMRKLGARTRAHAVAIALSERAIDLRP
jgi:DNA-binding CsgD family transcriptional regulator